MRNTRKILEELLYQSRQIVEFIDTHASEYSLPASKPRETYATAYFYICLDWHIAVVLLTDKQLRGSALTLIRPMLESWIRGTWVMLVPSNDEIEKIMTNNKILEIKKMSVLAKELKKKDEVIGVLIENVLKSVNSFLSGCIHGNASYLNLYLDKETQTIKPNVPDNKIAHMLDAANTIALQAAINMQALRMQALHNQALHELDECLLSPFTEKLDEYLVYSNVLLKHVSL